MTERGGGLADALPRLWTLWAAARPSQVALVVLVYALGVGMAAAGPPVVTDSWNGLDASMIPVLAGGLALIAVTLAVHYANEYADVETDRLTDRTPFSGGSGALVRTGLSRRFLGWATAGAVAASVLVIGVGVATETVPNAALAVLTLVFVLGLAYSLRPLALIYRGVGEVVNAVLGGILLPLYGVSVVATPRPAAVAAVVPFALLVGANLCATHWPDRKADATVGKRTLAVRLPPRRVRHLYATLAGLAALTTAALWAADVLPTAVALAHLPAAPLLLWGGLVLTRRRSPLPAVLAMVVVAATTTLAWWSLGVG